MVCFKLSVGSSGCVWVCKVWWMNCVAVIPHTLSVFVDVRSDAAGPAPIPHSARLPSKSQLLIFPVSSPPPPHGSSTLLLSWVYFRLTKMSSTWISITQGNCPLRKARRACLPSSISVSFDQPVCEARTPGLPLKKDSNGVDWERMMYKLSQSMFHNGCWSLY